jgi:hypothetical protein
MALPRGGLRYLSNSIKIKDLTAWAKRSNPGFFSLAYVGRFETPNFQFTMPFIYIHKIQFN